MLTSFFSFGLIILLGAMSPGPDFAIVTRNTLLHSRKSGVFTALGVCTAIIIHMTYCVFGLAMVISKSLFLFNLIKYVGASYLIYLGVSSFFIKPVQPHLSSLQPMKKFTMPHGVSFRQGFLCNLLNPEVMLFYLSLFTVTIGSGTPAITEAIYVLEIFIITIFWYCALAIMLSHTAIKRLFDRAEKYLAKALGASLVVFGVGLAFVRI